ncbi:probable G-protein coupled receptor 34 [Ornithorhynchus anatinus]|uniref:probable G-protein coupled receptor 34 n=1 Tax=Ornithorhynchus anatinus TaxID=9258 RepID=UPI0010A79A30|nr:probable G-protein coupled receptor 34 [Ornithorhynchus anatinus]
MTSRFFQGGKSQPDKKVLKEERDLEVWANSSGRNCCSAAHNTGSETGAVEVTRSSVWTLTDMELPGEEEWTTAVSLPIFRMPETETDSYPVPSLGSNCTIEDSILQVILPVAYSFIFVLSLLSNALALWTFCCTASRKNSMAVYMKNLAVADLLLSLCLPFRVAYQNREGPRTLCLLVGIFFYLNMYVSIAFLALISLDRFLKITRPYQQFRIHTVRWSTLAVCSVWAATILFTVPFFFEKVTGDCGARCFHFRSKNVTGAALNMAVVVIFYVLLLFFLFFSSRISDKLRQVSRGEVQPQSGRTNGPAITKTLVVLIIFILCFTPYHVVRVPYILAQVNVISSQPWKQKLHLANELMLCISALNSCLDPVIYFFLCASFRRAVGNAFQGKMKKAFLRHQMSFSNNSRSFMDF